MKIFGRICKDSRERERENQLNYFEEYVKILERERE
jgi:hypothetical protein